MEDDRRSMTVAPHNNLSWSPSIPPPSPHPPSLLPRHAPGDAPASIQAPEIPSHLRTPLRFGANNRRLRAHVHVCRERFYPPLATHGYRRRCVPRPSFPPSPLPSPSPSFLLAVCFFASSPPSLPPSRPSYPLPPFLFPALPRSLLPLFRPRRFKHDDGRIQGGCAESARRLHHKQGEGR
jgi:hypothetical protein